MDKEIKNLNDAQEFKSELEKFKQQQRELAQKLNQEGLNQVSPSTFEINDFEIPDDPMQAAQSSQVEQANQINNQINNELNQRVGLTSQFTQPVAPTNQMSKADLALQLLEEEILLESVEIYLPALKENVVIKPLKSIEELNLKTQNLAFDTFLRQINILLLTKTHIKNIPLSNYFKTIEEFEEKILPVDRLLLVFGLIKNSFDKLAEFSMVCENCQREFLASPSVKNLEFKFNITKDELVNTDYYNLKFTQSFLNGKLEIDFGFNPESVRMKLLSMKSNNQIKETVEETDNVLDTIDNLVMFIKAIRVFKEDKRTKEGRRLVAEITYENEGFYEIFKFIHDMPMKIRDIVLNESDLTVLEKYSPLFVVKEACPYCGHIHELDSSPEIEFFRKALSLLG